MYLSRLTSSGKSGKKSLNKQQNNKNNVNNKINNNKLTATTIDSIDKLINDGIISGDLNLSSKFLKEFPKFCNLFNLIDTINCDLSKNQLEEFPKELCIFIVLETLILYSNNIKSIPESVCNMKSLRLLDLSCNNLSYLPTSLCTLKLLEVLNVNNNKLVSLPEEICEFEKLIQLDVSCNEITHLPVQIGEMKSLRSLIIRRNLLVELPKEISKCKLVNFDCSFNRLTKLPLCFREIITLIDLNVDSNPLVLPPSSLCAKGLLHIMKYLLNETIKEEKKHGILTENEINFQYRGSILYQSTRKDEKIINHVNLFLNNLPDDRLIEKERVETRELSRKMHEEQIAIFEKQRYETQKISQQITSKDSRQLIRRLTSDNSYQNKNENSIDYQKNYLENRSYKSLSHLENNNSENNFDVVKNDSPSGSQNSMNDWSNNNSYSPPNNDVEDEIDAKNSAYTMRRKLCHAHEEYKQVDYLKRCIESKLKITLPDDVGNALSDGVVLCHLMNTLFPRAIQIIHVPSLAVPKLSIAKSRKNVESFIEACQKFGLASNEICCSQDLIESKNTHKVARTIMMILKYNQEIQYHNSRPQSTISNQQQQTAV
jgi:Leucine-rich repeat (LRR) protein